MTSIKEYNPTLLDRCYVQGVNLADERGSSEDEEGNGEDLRDSDDEEDSKDDETDEDSEEGEGG